MFAALITEFADRIVDELAPPTTDELADEGPGLRLAVRLDRLSRTGIDDAELLKAVIETARLRNIVDGLQTRLVSAASRIGVPERKRLRSPAALLTEIGVPPAVAHRTVRNGRYAQDLPSLAQGMRDGSLAAENADAVGRGVEFVDKRVALDDDARRALTRKLLMQETPSDIGRRAREFAIAAGAETDEQPAIPVAENSELNEMTLTSNDESRVTAEVDLDVVTGEELCQALDPLMQPVPEADGSADKRSTTQRRADALGHVIRAYLSGSDRPTSGGVLPHATLVVPTVGSTPPGMSPVASTMFTGPVSSATVELVLCDAALSAVTVDAVGAPLSVGREQRLFTPAMRRALLVRDRCCARPGCGRPAAWCDVHHVTPWSEGGETGIDNGVLLCRRCHTLIHHGGWGVFIGHDGHPWFVPPTDPNRPDTRRAIRSHARRTMTVHETADAA